MKLQKHSDQQKYNYEKYGQDKDTRIKNMKIDEFTSQNCFYVIPKKQEAKNEKKSMLKLKNFTKDLNLNI